MYDAFVENPIPTSVGLFMLAATIIVLNLIAIMVFIRKRDSKPPVDYPLLSLLIANLLQGTMTLPAYALKKINAFGDFEQAIICDVYRFSFFVCAHASIMSLLVSNVDRLIALFYSLRYWEIVTKTRISIAVSLTWLFVICFDMVPLLTPVENASCHYTPTKAWSVSMHIVMNIIPLPLLLAGYIVTIRIAYKHARKNDSFSSRNLSRREKVKIICGIRATKKVMLIIGCYFICVGPACVYYLLEWLCMSCFTAEYKIHREQYVHFFLKVLVNVYAVVSAIIFYWNSKDFRRKAREMLSGREKPKTSLDNVNSSIGDQRYAIKKNELKKKDSWEKDSDCSSLVSCSNVSNISVDSNRLADGKVRRDTSDCWNEDDKMSRANGSLIKKIFMKKIFAKSQGKDNVDNILLQGVDR